jgi:DNA-binding transcriptional LysR family regulator
MASEQVYIHGPSGSRFNFERPATWSSISEVPLILPRHPNFLRRKIEDASQRRGVALDVVMDVNTPPSIVSLVQQGHGFTVPAWMCLLSPTKNRHHRRIAIARPKGRVDTRQEQDTRTAHTREHCRTQAQRTFRRASGARVLAPGSLVCLDFQTRARPAICLSNRTSVGRVTAGCLRRNNAARWRHQFADLGRP